jgi:hypothetical protein
MNKRIKELIDKANEGLDGVSPGSQPMHDSSYNQFNKKFAELIVRECAIIVGSMEEPHQEIAELVKEHFGVE